MVKRKGKGVFLHMAKPTEDNGLTTRKWDLVNIFGKMVISMMASSFPNFGRERASTFGGMDKNWRDGGNQTD